MRGAEILRHVLGARTMLIAIEADMPAALAAVEKARSASGFEHIGIATVPAVYPTGGEKQLIQILTGCEVPARGIPADIGIVCQNVGTVAAVYRAIVHGEPLCSRIVTVTGRGVRHPQNLDVRQGTPIADLIEQCGDYTDEAERLILGGPMMGFAVTNDDLPVIKEVNAILVAGRGEVLDNRQPLPCIRCGACAEVCPARLLPQQLYWHARAEQLDRTLDHHLFDCIECGCCDVVCPSHIPLVQYFRAAKGTAMVRQRERDKAEHARQRFEAHQARKQQEQREHAETAERRKEHLSKAAAPDIRAAIARAKQKRTSKLAAPATDGATPHETQES
jgi:electron transport complex protein RnfC